MMFFNAEGSPGGGGSLIAPPAPPAGGAPPVDPGQQQQQAPTGWIGADGTFNEKWTENLNPELGDARNGLSKFKNASELATSYIGLQKMLGENGNRVAIPTADSKPEEIAAFRKAIGAPENADGYQLKPEKLPDGITWDDAAAANFAKIADKYHIPQAAMKELVAAHIASEEARSSVVAGEVEKVFNEGQKVLKTKWGETYGANIAKVQQLASLTGVDPNSSGFSDPNVVMAFAAAANLMSEDKFTNAGGPGLQAGKTSALDIINNPANPLHAKYIEGDPATVSQVRSMLTQAG